MPRTATCISMLLIAASMAPGCSRDSRLTAPQADDVAVRGQESVMARSSAAGGAHGWYPLAVGNSWNLRGRTVVRLHTPGSPSQVLRDNSFDIALDQTCADSADVFERFVERFPTGSSTIYRRCHQTRDGLGLTGVQVPPCSSGGSPPSVSAEDPPPPDIQALRYPLHPGQSWIYQMIGSFRIMATVEAQETLDTPIGKLPAWRIRIDRPFDKPGRDYRHVWYGRTGYLGLATHIENDVVENGVVTGVITSDEIHSIVSIQLV